VANFSEQRIFVKAFHAAFSHPFANNHLSDSSAKNKPQVTREAGTMTQPTMPYMNKYDINKRPMKYSQLHMPIGIPVVKILLMSVGAHSSRYIGTVLVVIIPKQIPRINLPKKITPHIFEKASSLQQMHRCHQRTWRSFFRHIYSAP
jgi:hypothetical protein